MGSIYDLPGMNAIMEYQRKLDKIYNSPWVKQFEQASSAFGQLSGGIDAFRTLQPAALHNIESIAHLGWPSWLDSIGHLDYSPVMEILMKEQTALSLAAPFSQLQSALSTYMSNWSAIDKVVQGSSLALQKEYAVAHAYNLVESISSLIDKEEEEISGDYPSELSDEDKQIIAEEVTSILSSDKNWEQRLMDSIIKLKSTHPVLAAIFEKVIFAFLLGIATSLIATAIGQALFPAKVYDEPKTTSQILYHLEPLEQVKIIGEQPYYYQIELTDSSTQETFTGFVSKRSIQQVDTEDETSALNAVD